MTNRPTVITLRHGWKYPPKTMYIDDLTGAIIEFARNNDWRCEASILYKYQNVEFEFIKSTPFGRLFSIKVKMDGPDKDMLLKELERLYLTFDVDAEAYELLSSDGHGVCGAPYRMRHVIEDVEASAEMIRELWDALLSFVPPDPY